MNKFSKTIISSALSCALIAGVVFGTSIKNAQADPKTIGSMSEKELQDFIGDYLINNPSVIIDALSAYETQQESKQLAGFKDQLAKHDDYIYNNDISPSIGSETADVTIVEFFDYNCGYCKRAMEDVRKILKEDDNVRVIFKELPILSDSSRSAAHYALAAAKQSNELYFEYHIALMEFKGPKNEKNLEKIAKKVGLDVKKLKEDANTPEIRMALINNLNMSKDLGVRGTPAFIIGESFAPGYIGYDNMKKAVELVREQNKKKK